MANQEVKVRISTDASQGIAGFNQFNSVMSKSEAQSASLVSRIKTHWLGLSAAIAGAGAIAYKGWDMMGKAADYAERIGAITALGAQYNMTGTQIVKSMTEASRGLLSMADAADMAAKSVNLNLSPDQMAAYTRVAEQLTDVIGGSIPEAYNKMVNAAAKGRVNSLREMGIVVDLDKAYEQYAKSLGRNVDSLSENEQMHIRVGAVLDAGKLKVEALGPVTDTTRDKMDRMVVTLQDLQLNMGQVLIRAAAGAAVAFYGVAGGIMGVIKAYADMRITMAEFGRKPAHDPLELFKDRWPGFYDFGKKFRSVTGSQDAEDKRRAEMAGDIEHWKEMSANAGWHRDDLFKKTEEYLTIFNSSVDELAAASKRSIIPAKEDMDGLGKKTEDLIKSWRTMETTIQGRMQLSGLEGVAKQLLENQLEADKLKEQFKELPKNIRIKAYAVIEKQRTGLDVKAHTNDAIDQMKKEVEFGVNVTEASIKRDKERGEAARDLYKDLRGYEGDYYQESLKLIDDHAGRYRAAGLDELAITKYIEEEKRKARLQLNRTTDAGTLSGGWDQGMKDWVKEIGNTFTFAEDMAKTTSRSMSKSFSDIFFDASKGQLKDFSTYFGSIMDAMLRKFTDRTADMLMEWLFTLDRMKVAKMASGLANFIGNAFGSGSTPGSGGSLIFGGVTHDGGIVGADRVPTRMMPATAWAGAPRLHQGFASDEFPAILQKGEGVFTPAQMKALKPQPSQPQQQNISVELVNRSGTPMQSSRSDVKFDGQQYVVSVFLDALNRNVGGLRTTLTGGS